VHGHKSTPTHPLLLLSVFYQEVVYLAFYSTQEFNDIHWLGSTRGL